MSTHNVCLHGEISEVVGKKKCLIWSCSICSMLLVSSAMDTIYISVMPRNFIGRDNIPYTWKICGLKQVTAPKNIKKQA